MVVTIYFDGAAAPTNPGTGACAVVVLMEGKREPVYQKASVIEPTRKITNNESEYRACLVALKLANRDYANHKVVVKGDSQLVVQQVNGNWECRADHLVPFMQECQDLFNKHQDIELIWIPREQNTVADNLTKIALAGVGIVCSGRPR